MLVDELFLDRGVFSGNYMVWLPRNLPERGALRYLLHRGRERVIPGILNLPHPAGASRPGQTGANPQANTLNLRKMLITGRESNTGLMRTLTTVLG
jgi:hypothetical protein